MDSPTTSQNLLAAFTVIRTPQGSLVHQNEQVVLERTGSGRLRPWRPQTIAAGEGIEVVEPVIEPCIRPRSLFDGDGDHNGEDEDELLTASLAEALAVDSGSEAGDDEELNDDQLSDEQLLHLLNEEEEDDLLPEEAIREMIWSEDYATYNPTQEEFEQHVGPKIDGTRPSNLFEHLWDQQLVDTIVKETNKYAWQNIVTVTESFGISAKSRLNDWVETTGAEIYRLIAVIILMGMCVRGRAEEYWTTGILAMPEFRAIMPKDRFILLFRFLHFVDNYNLIVRGDERKLAKIKPLIDYLNQKFQQAYSPRRELAIDESLLLWKGRLSWVQCIRSKAARFGIKSYELCESVTGYVLNIIVYTGKGTTTGEVIWGFTSSTAKIVIRLMANYLGKGYTLFMDNFYNSVRLCRFLKSRKTDVVGTLNRRRLDTPGDIKNLQEKRVARGSVVSRHCGDVSVVSWKDVKLVTTVSTYHNDEMVPGQRAGVACEKPKVVQEYNKFMGGDDLKDQKLSAYLLERKRGLKWYIKVFRRLLNITILNTYVIYCANIGDGRKLTHRQFRYALAAGLCEKYGTTGKPRSHSSSNSCARLDKSLDHFPEQKEVEEERASKVQNKLKRGRCVRCWTRKERKMVSISCSQCKVFLCTNHCWREYHTIEVL